MILTAEAGSLPTDAGNNNGHAAIFEVKLGKKTNRATEASRERSAEQFFNDLESVAFKWAMNAPTCTRTLRNSASTNVTLQG